MTVSSSDNKNTYNGDGSNTIFTYTFRILEEEQITVSIKADDGTVATSVLNIDYTVAGVNQNSGGSVTFATAPLSTDVIILTRDVPFTQETKYTEGDTFPVESTETAFDKLTMITQQIDEQADRVLTFDVAISEDFNNVIPQPVANQIMRASGDALSIEWDTITADGLSAVVDDPSPQLGGTLDNNSNYINIGDSYGIRDESSNEQLIFNTTANAVNYTTITNSATTEAPTISVDGVDIDIDISIGAKGVGEVILSSNLAVNNGLINIGGTSGASGAIRLQEDSDNGSNYVELKGASTLASNVSLELPDADGTDRQFLGTDGAGKLSFSSQQYELIATAVADNDTSIDFTDLGNEYMYHKIVFDELALSVDGTDFNVRFSIDNGVSFVSSGYKIAGTYLSSDSTSVNLAVNDSSGVVGYLQNLGNSSNKLSSGIIDIFHPVGKFSSLLLRANSYTASGKSRYHSQGGSYDSTDTVNAVRLLATSGNIVSGTIKLYGVRA